MITITSAQLDAWILTFMFPLARILGLLAVAPVFSNSGINKTARLIIGLAIAMALAPALPPMPVMAADSWQAIVVLLREAMLGTLMGLSLSLAFAAINIAGDLIGIQMGLSFAVLYDPQTQGQTPVITNLLTLLTILIFLASNGHLLILSLLAKSFDLLPVSAQPFAVDSLRTLVASAATLFSLGLLLSLPLVATLLITNIGLGILTRVAPTLNLFAVGFVVTLSSGFIMLGMSLPYFGVALDRLFDLCFRNFDLFLKAARAG